MTLAEILASIDLVPAPLRMVSNETLALWAKLAVVTFNKAPSKHDADDIVESVARELGKTLADLCGDRLPPSEFRLNAALAAAIPGAETSHVAGWVQLALRYYHEHRMAVQP